MDGINDSGLFGDEMLELYQRLDSSSTRQNAPAHSMQPAFLPGFSLESAGDGRRLSFVGLDEAVLWGFGPPVMGGGAGFQQPFPPSLSAPQALMPLDYSPLQRGLQAFTGPARPPSVPLPPPRWQPPPARFRPSEKRAPGLSGLGAVAAPPAPGSVMGDDEDDDFDTAAGTEQPAIDAIAAANAAIIAAASLGAGASSSSSSSSSSSAQGFPRRFSMSEEGTSTVTNANDYVSSSSSYSSWQQQQQQPQQQQPRQQHHHHGMGKSIPLEMLHAMSVEQQLQQQQEQEHMQHSTRQSSRRGAAPAPGAGSSSSSSQLVPSGLSRLQIPKAERAQPVGNAPTSSTLGSAPVRLGGASKATTSDHAPARRGTSNGPAGRRGGVAASSSSSSGSGAGDGGYMLDEMTPMTALKSEWDHGLSIHSAAQTPAAADSQPLPVALPPAAPVMPRAAPVPSPPARPLASHFASSSSSSAAAAAGLDIHKRPRFVWTELYHRRFLAAIFDIGLGAATPKALHEIMVAAEMPSSSSSGNSGLSVSITSDHIKSHLQKFRNHAKAAREQMGQQFDRALREAREEARQKVLTMPGGTTALETAKKHVYEAVTFTTYPVAYSNSSSSGYDDSYGDDHHHHHDHDHEHDDGSLASLAAAVAAAGGGSSSSSGARAGPCARCREVSDLMRMGVGLVLADPSETLLPLAPGQSMRVLLAGSDAAEEAIAKAKEDKQEPKPAPETTATEVEGASKHEEAPSQPTPAQAAVISAPEKQDVSTATMAVEAAAAPSASSSSPAVPASGAARSDGDSRASSSSSSSEVDSASGSSSGLSGVAGVSSGSTGGNGTNDFSLETSQLAALSQSGVMGLLSDAMTRIKAATITATSSSASSGEGSANGGSNAADGSSFLVPPDLLLRVALSILYQSSSNNGNTNGNGNGVRVAAGSKETSATNSPSLGGMRGMGASSMMGVHALAPSTAVMTGSPRHLAGSLPLLGITNNGATVASGSLGSSGLNGFPKSASFSNLALLPPGMALGAGGLAISALPSPSASSSASTSGGQSLASFAAANAARKAAAVNAAAKASFSSSSSSTSAPPTPAPLAPAAAGGVGGAASRQSSIGVQPAAAAAPASAGPASEIAFEMLKSMRVHRTMLQRQGGQVLLYSGVQLPLNSNGASTAGAANGGSASSAGSAVATSAPALAIAVSPSPGDGKSNRSGGGVTDRGAEEASGSANKKAEASGSSGASSASIGGDEGSAAASFAMPRGHAGSSIGGPTLPPFLRAMAASKAAGATTPAAAAMTRESIIALTDRLMMAVSGGPQEAIAASAGGSDSGSTQAQGAGSPDPFAFLKSPPAASPGTGTSATDNKASSMAID